jgi:2-amino-4-hydroxy-6-hydroxymethyldihydropteridine diphosphokinase
LIHRAYLLLGSNIDKERNLARAVSLLDRWGRLCAVSAAYETSPVGRPDQPSFLNAAVLLQTSLEGDSFKRKVAAGIERSLGRRRDPADPNAPRTIDIDIALWDDLVGEIAGRAVPDPEILTRVHIAVPLAEIAPTLCHPRSGEPLASIAARLVARSGQPLRRPDVELMPGSGPFPSGPGPSPACPDGEGSGPAMLS